MNTGKRRYSRRRVDFLPWSTFDRIVARYINDRRRADAPCAPHSIR